MIAGLIYNRLSLITRIKTYFDVRQYTGERPPNNSPTRMNNNARPSAFLAFYPNCHPDSAPHCRPVHAHAIPAIRMKRPEHLAYLSTGHRSSAAWQPRCHDYFRDALTPSTSASLLAFDRIKPLFPSDRHEKIDTIG